MLNIHTNPAPLNDLELQEIEQLAQLAVKGRLIGMTDRWCSASSSGCGERKRA
jgi:hypothetical protein